MHRGENSTAPNGEAIQIIVSTRFLEGHYAKTKETITPLLCTYCYISRGETFMGGSIFHGTV